VLVLVPREGFRGGEESLAVPFGHGVQYRRRAARVKEHDTIRVTFFMVAGYYPMVIKEDRVGTKVSSKTLLSTTVLDLVDAVADPQIGSAGRLEILKKLLERDPSLIAKAVPSEQVPGLLPLEKGREAVGELARLVRLAPEESRAGLRKVGAILVEAFRHDPRVLALMRQFLTSEAADMMPVWMSEEDAAAAQETGPAARAKTLLALPADEQAEPLLQEAASLVRELLGIARTDLAAKLLARLTGLLVDRQTDRRHSAAQALLDLHPAWDNDPLSAAREGFETLLRTAIDAETDGPTYGKLAELAAFLADGRLRRSEPELALETLSLLRRHHGSKEPATAFRAEIAFRALERVSRSEGFPTVLKRLRDGDSVALRLAESLGDAAAAPLVEEIKKIDTVAHRIPFADALSRIGPSAAALLSEELQKCTIPADALRLLEALPQAAPEEIATVALSSTLHHPSNAVRRRTAEILTERAYARSGELLLQEFRDEKEPTNRATILEGLGKLRVSAAFEILASVADERSESDDLRAAACTALARLGHAEAIPILAGIASKRSRGMGLLKSASPGLRNAAIRALGHFPTNPAAREALKKITEDSDPVLQAAARQTLYNPCSKDEAPAPAPHSKPPTTVKLAGSIQEVSFDQICQLCGSGEKTGLLLLTLEGRPGRVWFENGHVIGVEFERLQDQAAFNAIARQKKGDFVFQPGERPAQRRIDSPVQLMLLEAARIADESQK